ncbi:MAG: GAF domain-containing protein [Dehalococcoidia bacterium]|nr:GAF domain-containing protein [Dehalococcoidia bacterium]
MNLTGKMVLRVVLGLLVVSASFGFISMWALRQSTERTLQERLLLARVAAESIDHYNRGVMRQLADIATSSSIYLEDGNLEQARAILKSAQSRLFAHDLFLLDGQAKVVAIEPGNVKAMGTSLFGDAYVQSAYLSRQPRISGILPSLFDGVPVVMYLLPIVKPDNSVLGAVGATVDLTQNTISGFIEPIKLGNTGYAQVVDGKGELLASTQPAQVFGKSDHGDRFIMLIQDKTAVVRTCHSCHQENGAAEKRKDVLAFAPLMTASWGIAVRQSEEEALGPTQRLGWETLAVGLVSLVFASGLTVVFIGRLLNPVRMLTESAQRIAAGDLTGRIEAKGEGEISILGRTFEGMRARLEASRKEIELRTADIERRNLELSALNSIAVSVSRSLNLEESLGATLDKVLAVLGGQGGGIFIVEDEGQPMVVKAQRGLSPSVMKFLAGTREKGVSAQISESRLPDSIVNGKPLTLLTLPLLSKGKIQGVLVVLLPENRGPEASELDLLRAIGHQIGVAVDNAKLFQEEQRRECEAEALYKVGVEISSLLDVDKVLNSVVEKSRQLLGADVALLSLLDQSGEGIYIRATAGARVEAFSKVMLRVGQGFTGKVVELGQPVLLEDYLDDPTISHEESVDSLVKGQGLRSHLGVPLKIGDKVLGALTVARRRVERFRDRETDLLSRLANQAALAIDNARLYEEVQRKEEIRGQLLERVISVQEDERRRIARELHDDSAQTLTALTMQLESIESSLPSGMTEVKRKLAKQRALTVQALEDIRRLMADLRPTALDDLGLLPAIRWYASERLQEKGVKVIVDSPGAKSRLPTRLETALFRVVQEAVNNIAKHAKCSNARITLRMDESMVRLTVEDDGKGFDVQGVLGSRGAKAGVGLLGMRERVLLFGGTINIKSAPGEGCKIIVEVPLRKEEPGGKDRKDQVIGG